MHMFEDKTHKFWEKLKEKSKILPVFKEFVLCSHPSQVFETFLKCDKLLCKSTFNKKTGMFTEDRTH